MNARKKKEKKHFSLSLSFSKKNRGRLTSFVFFSFHLVFFSPFFLPKLLKVAMLLVLQEKGGNAHFKSLLLCCCALPRSRAKATAATARTEADTAAATATPRLLRHLHFRPSSRVNILSSASRVTRASSSSSKRLTMRKTVGGAESGEVTPVEF